MKNIKIWQVSLNTLFVVLIVLPLVIALFSKSTHVDLTENRQMQMLPSFTMHTRDLKQYTQQFNAYFDDNFGFRRQLIRWRSGIMAHVFGISASSKVIIGKDNWLYYDGEKGEDVIDNYYRGTAPFNQQQLETITANLINHQKWLAKQKIAYYVVIAPDKESIYPEYLPPYLNQVNPITRLDQVVQYLQAHSSVPIIDLRPTLIAHKNAGLLYYKTDTHWNALGALYGYQKISQVIAQHFPAIKQFTGDDFIKTNTVYSGDLARMLDLNQVFSENVPLLQLRKMSCAKTINLPQYNTPGAPAAFGAFATECANTQLPKAVIIRDSFTIALIPMLGENFSRAVYLWTYNFPYSTIKKEKPNMVIQELIERNLGTLTSDK